MASLLEGPLWAGRLLAVSRCSVRSQAGLSGKAQFSAIQGCCGPGSVVLQGHHSGSLVVLGQWLSSTFGQGCRLDFLPEWACRTGSVAVHVWLEAMLSGWTELQLWFLAYVLWIKLTCITKNSHSGQRSTRHCSTTFQLKSKLKYILIIEILDQDPHSYWALNPEFESLLCLILNLFYSQMFYSQCMEFNVFCLGSTVFY